nr:arsenate reductase [uncultured bacterium]
MVVIHHNPDCGTSRNVLQIIKAAGYNPIVIEYLKKAEQNSIVSVICRSKLNTKNSVESEKSPAKKLGLLNENITDEAILEAMLAHPVLVNRPIVCTEKGVKLCRPSEQVLTLLAQWPKGELYKEDGEMILNAQGEQPKN